MVDFATQANYCPRAWELDPLMKKTIQIAAGLFFLAGLAFAGVVLLLVYNGAPWAYIFYADKPLENLAISAVCFFGWYFLKYGINNSRRKWLLSTARMTLLIVSLGLSLAAAEVGLRVYLYNNRKANSFKNWKELHAQGRKLPVRTMHPIGSIISPCENKRLIYELQSNLDMDFAHRRLKTNSAGMRASREYPVERLANSVRILGLGDSGMFGWDVEQDENYLHLLEKHLNDRQDGVTYEVLNFAVPGYNTQLECEHLRSKGLAYKPDIVIVGWCNNDYSLPFFLLQETDFRSLDISFVYCLLFDREKLRVITGPPEFRELRKFDKEKVLPETVQGTTAKGVQQAMRDLNELSHQNGFRLLVIGPMDATIVKICRDAGISHYNTLDNIPADKYPREYAIHYMHPRKEGHAVLAKALEKYLSDQNWLKPK
jgi:lysophospholipase L1-like esterase